MIGLSLQTIIMSVAQIMLLGLVGYCFYRFKAVDDNGLDILAKLVINLFLPCFIASEFLGKFSFESNPDWWKFPLLAFIISSVGILLSAILIYIFKLEHKREFSTLITFQNSGYIPLLMVTTLFSGAVSDKLFLYIFLLLIGFNISMWTFGIGLITGQKINRKSLQSLINAPFIVLMVSLLIAATGINKHVPAMLMKQLKMLGDCVLPIAMMVIGGNLGRLRIGRVKREVIVAVAGKLILMPAIGLLAIYFLKPNFFISFLIIIETATPSAITPSIIARHYNAKDHVINLGIFYTHILSMVTIPAFLYIYAKVVGI